MGNLSSEAAFMLDIDVNNTIKTRKVYGSQGMVPVKINPKSFGALHVHNLGIDPMFDPGDLIVICKMADMYVPPPPNHAGNYYNPSILFNIMVVNDYAYAVVPNDIQAFKTKCDYLNNNWKKLNLKIQMEFKKIKKEGLTNQLDFAKVFLDFINNPNDPNLNCNVSLYRISTSPLNQNNWKELTLDSTKPNGIKEDACN